MWIIEGAIVVPQAGFIIRIKISNSIIASKGGQGPSRQFDPPPRPVGRDKSGPYIFWLNRLFEMYCPLRVP